jgi:hypothetical protein
MKTSKHTIERIESLLATDALTNLTESIDIIIEDMIEEGWEYEEISDYLSDKVECAVTKHRIETAKDDLQIAQVNIIGKQVVIIDETRTENNVFIKTISDFEVEGMIWFEEDNGGTSFHFASDIELFIQGKKAFIHPDEISIQLIN